jgi:LysM repeat protein
LTAWAALTGSIYLQPIQGCYSGSVTASKGTHDGGGVYDIEADGLSLTDYRMVVNAGRKAGLVTFGRWWTGNHHVHLIDPECPDLAPEAEDQMEQYRRGETGLVGYDPDPWNRTNAPVLLRQYDARHASGPKTYTIPKGGTLGKAAVALGVALSALVAYNHIPDPNLVQPGTVVTAPPKGYTAPAPKPSTAKPAPKPSTAKPAPKPKPKPRPVVKPKPKPKPLPSVYTPSLRVGRSGASVLTYERALRAYLGAKTANRYGLTAARASDRYFGTATATATRAAYKRLGVTPWATSPGPFLLRTLHLKATR